VSVVELDDGYALFEAQTGFAGRVNFERHAFWQAKECVYWVSATSAALPWRLRLGAWPGSAPGRAYRRLERNEIEGCVANWLLEGRRPGKTASVARSSAAGRSATAAPSRRRSPLCGSSAGQREIQRRG
jgi:hypothetical protein